MYTYFKIVLLHLQTLDVEYMYIQIFAYVCCVHIVSCVISKQRKAEEIGSTFFKQNAMQHTYTRTNKKDYGEDSPLRRLVANEVISSEIVKKKSYCSF